MAAPRCRGPALLLRGEIINSEPGSVRNGRRDLYPPPRSFIISTSPELGTQNWSQKSRSVSLCPHLGASGQGAAPMSEG